MTGAGEMTHNTISKALSASFGTLGEHGDTGSAVLSQAWKWLTRHSRGVLVRGTSRRLKVAETVSLGEKRFVSILQVDGEQFLVGGSPSNIVLLARLEAKPDTVRAGSFESIFSLAESHVGESQMGDKGSAGGTQ